MAAHSVHLDADTRTRSEAYLNLLVGASWTESLEPVQLSPTWLMYKRETLVHNQAPQGHTNRQFFPSRNTQNKASSAQPVNPLLRGSDGGRRTCD